MKFGKKCFILLAMVFTLPLAIQAQGHPRAYVRSVRSMVLFEGIENRVDIELKNIHERQVDITTSDDRAKMTRVGIEDNVLHYTVVPAQMGTLTITVQATINDMDYDLGYNTFKVQHLPMPLLLWSGSISGEVVNRRQICDSIIARIPGTFFDEVHFEVRSFRITIDTQEPISVQGCMLTNEMKKAISRAPRGARVLIDHVVVISPNGQELELGSEYTLN